MNEIQKYFKYRQSLIDQYVKGDMTKNEYLAENLNAVLSLNIKPFKNIDNIEKGLFNYQYYNAMAKESKMSGTDNNADVDYYYRKKEQATYAVLKILDYRNVTAYFIRVNSKYLRGKLFEIVIEDYQMILHSASDFLLNLLRREGVFHEETRESLIDGYINQKYF